MKYQIKIKYKIIYKLEYVILLLNKILYYNKLKLNP